MNNLCPSSSPRKLWDQFCFAHGVLENCVPLFATDGELVVQTKEIGRQTHRRKVLMRSQEMERMVCSCTRDLINDLSRNERHLDGLIYVMGYRRVDHFEPLYIGKTETEGKTPGILSVNLERLDTDTSKFARWGDNAAYHIGDLSACVIDGHPGKKTPKYLKWAEALFHAGGNKLYEEVFFWAKPWDHRQAGVWAEFGSTNLTFLEYLLIGVASRAFGGLLNVEGKNRTS